MRISELLISMALWLESPDNEALLLSEGSDDCMAVVASYCVEAADTLKKAAELVDSMEPQSPSLLNAEGIESLAALATSLDSTGDAELIKQASLIDELLISISAPSNALSDKQAQDEKKIKELSDKYYGLTDELHDANKTADVTKDIEPVIKNYKNLEAPMSTRHCPDHPGTQISRIGDNLWQCELDKKKYDFAVGYELMDGSKVPGGDVSLQTEIMQNNEYAQFDTREGRLNSNKV